MDKKTIIRNFSRYAHTYDRYADIQKLTALKLLEDLPSPCAQGLGLDGQAFGKILELGCGTGNYTLLLKDKFEPAGLKAVDISGQMIEVARQKLTDKRIDGSTPLTINPERSRRIDFIVADAETLSIDEKFDCITSNACFQWFDDLGRTMQIYKRLLKKDGTILFSIFGPLTFRELSISLRGIFKNSLLGANQFMGKDRIKEILEQNFKRVSIKEVIYKERFMHLWDLLHKIKYSGISAGALNGKISLNRRFLNRLEEIYLDKFKQIKATYQVFFCRGIKG